MFTNQTNADNPAKITLEAIRKHLGMEVAYISEFVGDRSVFIEVDAPGLEALIKPGDSRSLDEVYCRHILSGQLPQLMADTSDYELARSMPITAAVPIGAHMSVPIHHTDGRILGMFCCLSPTPNRTLTDRDLQVMTAFADIAGKQITQQLDSKREVESKRLSIESVVKSGAFNLAFQPIWDFRSGPTGFEVLCRFTPEPYRSPDKWFADAHRVERGIDLEIAVLQKALACLDAFPESIFLSVNASPLTVISGRLTTLLKSVDAKRIALEITEHAEVSDYSALIGELAPLRAAGLRLAIDDAGAGYSSLQHIVQLTPDIIKLDMSLTRAVDTDPARRALTSALIYFARETGSIIVAEGIETESELDTLRILGVPKGQGYFLGRPMDLASALAMIESDQGGRAVG
jgi:EAL domain-containing protein (putative c-di-GMP-specific phosphodiesterase class I)